ncbi:ferric uptake regulator, FUR family [Acidisarcina polymorpha]|uniref:Ferric uptake regulator, FUR family n=2 Tax=Acidisarcina polymorpha TaxID=2211140 RepID=A0A2Z5FWV6_9BACT|nr:transcriptional repressor [Acidisarcina polymorpha]AXC11379.1 ferric uptake regulator, FUR family [Acidisarcina polymorpha]
MNANDTRQFRSVCESAGLAVTHQRQVVYEVLRSTHGHPSPEEVYARVRRKIPSISLATVYKTIHSFIEGGIFHEVSLHHGSLRVETNQTPHHHLVCTHCRSIHDIDESELGLTTQGGKLPGGFLVERYAIDVLGRCPACQQAEGQAT